MLQACLNGDRSRRFHPATPRSPAELAADARRVVLAGARELHFHPRNERGAESLDPDHTTAALCAVRAAAPGVPLGLSTAWTIPPSGPTRREHLQRWRELPDFVSVNLVEADAPEIMALMLAMGVGIEAGLWSVADAVRFVGLPDAVRCRRVLVEINEQNSDEGLVVANRIIELIEQAGPGLPVLLHGYDATVWPMYREALARGFDQRIGLEDGKWLPNGEVAAGNAELITAARQLAQSG